MMTAPVGTLSLRCNFVRNRLNKCRFVSMIGLFSQCMTSYQAKGICVLFYTAKAPLRDVRVGALNNNRAMILSRAVGT